MENNRDGDVETWSYYRTSLKVLSQSVYTHTCVLNVSNEDLLIHVRKQNLCLISLVPISFCTHPSFTAQITRVFTVFASKRESSAFIASKRLDPPGTWILIGALILLGVPSCQSQASRRQSAINSINGRACCQVNQPLEILMWHVPCHKLFHASCFLLTIVDNDFNPIWFHPAMSVSLQLPGHKMSYAL